MVEKIVNVVFQESGLDSVNADAQKLGNSLNDIEGANKSVTGSFKESSNSILENGGAMGLLNEFTGGYAMTVKDAVEASGLFSKGTAISTGVQKIYTTIIGSSTGALKAFKLALASTGIGIIVVALGFFFSKMNEAEEATEAQKQAQESLSAAIKRTTEDYKRQIDEINSYTQVRKLNAEILGKSTEDLLKIDLEASEERIAALKSERDALYEQQATKELTVEQSADINKRILEGSREITKEINGQEILRLQFQKGQADERREAEKKAQEERLEAFKKRNEERLAAEREFRKQLLAELEIFKTAVFNAEERQYQIGVENETAKQEVLNAIRGERRLTELQAELESSRAILEAANATIDERLELETSFIERIREIEAAYQEEKINNLSSAADNEAIGFEERLSVLDEQQKMILDAESITEEQRTQMLAENADKRNEIRMAEVDSYAKQGQAIGNILNQASELAGKNTSKGKLLAAASATVNTLSSAVAAFKGMTEAIPGPVGIAAGAVASAFALASGFATVKKIYAVKVPGGDAGGGGAAGGSAPAPPSFNIVGQSNTNQLAQSINQNQQQTQPIKAYVVGGEVTTQQAMERQTVATATFN